MKSFEELQKETRTVQIAFLMADLSTGNTFLDVARTTHDAATRARNVQNAKDAWNTVSRLSTRVVMTEEQGIDFQEKLDTLGERIRSMDLPPSDLDRPRLAS